MAPGSTCRMIVRTESGQSTDTGDSIYVCDDGSRWKQTWCHVADATNAPQRGYMHGNFICDHE